MKYAYLTVLTLVCCTAFTVSSSAQSKSLRDLFGKDAVKSALDAVTQEKEITPAALAGTWKYAGPACEFQSDDMLKKAGGALVSAQIEQKLDNLYSKVGITPGQFTFTFAADSTFSCKLGAHTVGGTYTLDNDKQQIGLNYKAVGGTIPTGSMNARIVKSGNTLRLLFNADKLMEGISLVAKATKNTTLSSLAKVTDAYDGMQIGYELVR